jgi:nucleotide-binding universal stress UspA family protein
LHVEDLKRGTNPAKGGRPKDILEMGSIFSVYNDLIIRIIVEVELVFDDCSERKLKGGMHMEVKKVLWPTDFSNSAEKALPFVTSLTQKYQAEIHVLYVIEDIAHHESWYGDFDRSHVDKLMQYAEKSATKRLEQVCEKYLNSCPLYIKHIAVGDPAQEILKLIDKEEVDMVVMASHGEKGHYRFGSVTEKVVKNAPIPVTTIPIEAQ